MTNQNPITPPPELVQQWIKECDRPDDPRWQEYEQDIANRAAQWGADQELEACCEWVSEISGKYGPRLRAARRPKPPSLKEQALADLAAVYNANKIDDTTYENINYALKQLND